MQGKTTRQPQKSGGQWKKGLYTMVLKILMKIIFDSENKINNNQHYRNMGVTIMEFILSELAKPILRRLGTVLGTALLSMGYAAEQTVAVETAVTSLGLIIIDLVLSNKERKKNV